MDAVLAYKINDMFIVINEGYENELSDIKGILNDNLDFEPEIVMIKVDETKYRTVSKDVLALNNYLCSLTE